MVNKKPVIKRVTLTGVQKKSLCLKKKAQPHLTQAKLAKLKKIRSLPFLKSHRIG